MANLLLTTDCQRNCSYCFAKQDRNKHMMFTLEDFMTALNFISTGPRALNLLGGEPTLHPDFSDMLAHLIENDFRIQVFTNGMIRRPLLNKINSVLNRIVLRESQLLFAVNMNEEKYRTKEEDRLQRRFLDSMGHLAFPCFTIHENADLLFLQKLIEDYYLDPSIRLGLAMPIIGAENNYLHRRDYRTVVKCIIDLCDNSKGTTINFDCGFPLCMFELEELSRLKDDDENDFAFICGVPLDIYPDLTMINCYPLANVHKAHMSQFSSIQEAYDYFGEGLQKPDGIYGQKCVECQFFRKSCLGGCKGFIS